MKKTLFVILLAVALSALLTAAAFACGEKKTDAEKASTDTKAKVCPAAAVAHVCDAADKPAGTAMASEEDGKWSTRTISIKGMTCTGCEKSVSAALAEVPGVAEVVKVCHSSKEAVVRIDPAKAKDELLTTAVVNKGYEAKIIPAVAKAPDCISKGKVCPLSGGPGCAEKASKASVEKTPEETK